MIRLIALVICLWSFGANADVPLSLDGHAVEGGLMFGKTDAQARVTLDKNPVLVSKEGHFLIGFGRDSAGIKNLEVALGNEIVRREINVVDREFKIERINGLPGKKVTPNPKAIERITKEKVLITDAKRASDSSPHYLSGFGWPVIGRLSGVYGSQRVLNGKPRRPHYGTDVAAPTRTPVRAVAAGRVAFVHSGMFFNGKTVLIDHGLGLRSVYIHLSDAKVTKDAYVAAGDVIGAVGATGRATGPHLHFGVTHNATPIDPEVLLGEMPR